MQSEQLAGLLRLVEGVTGEDSEEAQAIVGMLEAIAKAKALAERTAEAMHNGRFNTNRQHPSVLTKEQVVVNPPAFERIDEQAGCIYEELIDQPWIIGRAMFEFISMPDGRLRVVYPMFGKEGELDLEADIAEMRWVGDVVAGYVEPADWHPVTVMGSISVLTVAAGGIDE